MGFLRALFGTSKDEIWSQIGGEPVPDRWITDPSGRYHHDYRQLCSDIRRRVVKAAAVRACPPKASAEEPAITTEQLSLF